MSAERRVGDPAPVRRDPDFWPQASRKALHPTIRALGHRNYRLYFGGQLVSLTGTWMQSVAQSWLVYRLTGSAVLLGLVGFAGQFPCFLLAPLGGGLADTRNRHRIIIATQAAAMALAFALAALTLTGRVAIWHVFALAALLGVVNAIDLPTRQAFLSDMVSKGDLSNAIALNSSMVNGARIVGPAVAGLVVAEVGEGWCFLGNGVSYLAVLSGLLAMRVEARRRPAREVSALAHVAEGFSYVARTAPIRALLLLLGLVSLMGMPYATLMPIFADRILHGGSRGLGLLMGASGLGAFVGALSLTARSGVRGLGRWVAWAAAGFGTGLIAFALSRTFWLSAALLVPVGFSMMFEMAASNTLIQAMVPDRLRGRVMAVYSMMFMGMAPFGALLAGALAQRLGAPGTVVAGGAACIVGAVVFGLRLPALRAEGLRLVVAQEAAGGDPPEERTGTAMLEGEVS
ncbi:MAG TPA: MFS transporter [Isosphaeraceae bacterium]|nr:MFS transporter [Isosphaeraceae bacterium]